MAGVYLKDITNVIFFNFALECESYEPLVFLSRDLLTSNRLVIFLCQSAYFDQDIVFQCVNFQAVQRVITDHNTAISAAAPTVPPVPVSVMPASVLVSLALEHTHAAAYMCLHVRHHRT